MDRLRPQLKKPSFPISEGLRSYLQRYRRERALPVTYDRLIHRLKGVRTAALYAKEQMVFSTKKLPARFESWKAYRDFLMGTWTGTPEHLAAMRGRFATQADNETVYRQQVKQLQINDWENNVPVINNHREESPLKKWMDLL
jgi:predicted phosphoadenosine phosphosulfate sulfurtransferase